MEAGGAINRVRVRDNIIMTIRLVVWYSFVKQKKVIFERKIRMQTIELNNIISIHIFYRSHVCLI